MRSDLTGTQDLRSYLRILWRWKLLFAAFVILIPLAVYLSQRGQPNVYQSSTLIELQDVSEGGASSAPTVTGNINAVARLVTTTPVARLAARYIHPHPADPASLLGEISASADQTTGFVTITGQAGSPQAAAKVANAFASALGAHQSNQAIAQLNQQIAADRTQLAGTPRSDSTDRNSLRQQIAQLEGLKGASRSGAQVIQAATANPAPVGPHIHRTVELALLIAILLGVGAVLLAENADRRLRAPEDLEGMTNWPLLAAIPPSVFEAGELPTGREQEAFHMLNASLALFTLDEPVSSIAVISPLVADGKTTVALGLARAAARAGKRVILVDADLRRPQITSRLGLHPSAGVVAALAGQEALEGVLVACDVNAPDGADLRVLPAGPTPPNPVAILSSPQMHSLIGRLEEMADLVIVDTAAALAVSDSLPLLRTVSGVMVVVRMNRSASGPIRRLQKVLSSAHVKVLGSVATGSESPGAGYGDYDYYYAPATDADGRTRRLRRRRLHPELSRALVASGAGEGNGNGNGHSNGNGNGNGNGKGRTNGTGGQRTAKERKHAVNSLLGNQRTAATDSPDRSTPPTDEE